MAATTQQDWIAEALDLHEQGLSERAIAEAVGKSNSTVHKYLKIAIEGAQHAESDETLAERQKQIADEAHEAATATPGQLDIDGGEVPAQQEPSYVEQLRVDGTTQVAIDFGGKRPQSGTLTFSGKAEVDGFFVKGETVTGTFAAVIVGVGAKDKIDKQTGVVLEAAQSHVALLTYLSVSAAP